MNDTQITLTGLVGGDVTLREFSPKDGPSPPSGAGRAPRRATATGSG